MSTHCWLSHLLEQKTKAQAQEWSTIGRITKRGCSIPNESFWPQKHLHPPSNRNILCLSVIDAFSRFLMVYPVTNTGAQATISAVQKWIHSFGIPETIVRDRGTAFINTDFVNWTEELGITLRLRTAHSSWTNGEVETQSQFITRYWRNFLNDAGNNWSSLAPKFASTHNTSVNYRTGKSPYEIVFGTKHQIPMSLKLVL